jgi:hypothetical protein
MLMGCPFSRAVQGRFPFHTSPHSGQRGGRPFPESEDLQRGGKNSGIPANYPESLFSSG